MAKRRTKKDKQQAAKRRRQTTRSIDSTAAGFTYKSSGGIPQKKRGSQPKSSDILAVDAAYIVTDLKKTVYLSLLFTALIFALYWFLELGGKEVLL